MAACEYAEHEPTACPQALPPSDASGEERAFVAPYLALVRADAPQRHHDLRQVFNALRWVVHTGAPRRWLPQDLPPWDIVYQQSRRWLDAGVFEVLVADLRLLLCVAEGRLLALVVTTADVLVFHPTCICPRNRNPTVRPCSVSVTRCPYTTSK